MSTKKEDNITISLDLKIDSGHIAKLDDELTFNVVIKNRNDYNRSLTNLNFTYTLDDTLLSFIEDSLTQDETPITKNEDGSYTIEDIDNNSESIIKFKASVISLSNSETSPTVTLNYSYLDNNDETKTSSISDDYYLYLTNPLQDEFNINQSVDLENATVDDDLTYTLELTNNSGETFNYVFIKNIFDEYTNFIESSVIIDGTPMEELNIINGFEVGAIDNEQTKSITYKVKAIKRGTASPTTTIVVSKDEEPVTDLLSIDSLNAQTVVTLEINNDLEVIKSSDKTHYIKDNVAKFEITITNNGNVEYKNLQLEDVLDENVEFIENTLKLDGYTLDEDPSNTTIGFLDVLESKKLTFNTNCINIKEDILNKATVNGIYLDNDGTEITENVQSNEISFDITEPLTIEKTVNKHNFNLTENVDYTVTITNTGISSLNNIKITDVIDNHLMIVPNSIKVNDTIKEETEINNMSIDDIEVNDKAIITFSTRTINLGEDIPNTMTISASYLDEENNVIDVNKNSNTVLINVLSETIGAVLFTKEVDKTICNLGDELNFILKFKNIGTVDLEYVHLAENLDEMFTYIDGSTKIDNVISGNIITGIDFETLSVNEEHRIDFKVTANTAYDKIPNTAVMAAYYDDVTLNPITNEVYVKVLGDPVINGSLTIETDKDTYYINDIVPFKIILTNTGTITYDEVIITDILPNNLEFINNSLKIDNITLLNKDIKDGVSINNISPNEIKTISFNTIAKKTGTNIVNDSNAEIKYILNDETKTFSLESNDETFNINSETSGLMEIEKYANSTLLHENDITTVTLRLKNLGNTTLNNIVVYDYLPEGLEFIENSLKIDYVEVEGNIKNGISISDMLVDYVTFVTFNVKATTTGEIINEAYATYSYIDSDSKIINSIQNSNSLLFNITNTKLGQMEIDKSSNKNIYNINDEAIFNFIVINTGNTDNTNVFVKDDLPENYEFIENSILIDGETFEGDITEGINIGNINKNSFKIIDFKAKAISEGSNIVNNINGNFTYVNDDNIPVTVDITSNNNVTNISDNTVVDIEFKKESYRESITQNDNNIFRLIINNIGSKKISNVIIQDLLNEDYEFVNNSIKVDGNNFPGNITNGINIGEVLESQKVIIEFEAKGINIKDNIENKASINYEYNDGESLMEETLYSNVVRTNIIEDVDAIIVINETIKYDNDYLNEENTVYLSISNIGDVDATNVKIKNMLEKEYNLVENSTFINGIKTLEDITDQIVINEIKPNETIDINFNIIGNQIKDNIKNVTNVSYKFNNILNEPITETISSNEVITNIILKKAAILKIEKTSTKNSILLGENNEFNLKITNIGNTDAFDIKIVDLVPNNYEINSSNIRKGILIDRILPNEIKTISYTGKGITLGKSIENIANGTYKYINALNDEINEFVSSNTNITNVLNKEEAVIFIEKRQLKNNLIKGENNTFNLILQNIGNKKANNIVVKDLLPINYTNIKGSLKYNGNPFDGDITNGILINDLDINQIAVISFDVTANNTGKDILNIANVKYNYLNEASEIIRKSINSNEINSNIDLYKSADLKLEKLVYPTSYVVGDTVRYKIYVKNNGNCPAKNIIIKDILPIELKFVNGSIYVNGNNNRDDTNENINIGTIMPNEEVIVEFEVICLTKGEIDNKSEADFMYERTPNNFIDKHIESNHITIIVNDKIKPLLDISQTVLKEKLNLYETNTFTYTLTNNGNTDLENIKLNNYLNEDYTLIKNSIIIDDNYFESNQINPEIIIGTLQPNKSKTVSFNAIASISNSNIINFANSSYEYIDNGEIVYGGINSEELFTNITSENTATLELNVDIPTFWKVNEEFEINTNITNIGDVKATNITFKNILDNTFEIVPNSLKINDTSSTEDILLGINFVELNPTEIIKISYKILPKAIKSNGIITSDLDYNYIDENGITRNITNSIDKFIMIISDNIPNISLVKDSNQLNYLHNDIVTFRLVISNNSDIEIFNIKVSDILPINYEYIYSSIKIDGEVYEDDLPDIEILNIEPRKIKVITFETIARLIGSNIPNTASMTYSYYNENDEKIDSDLESNTFNTNILEDVLPDITIIKEVEKLVLNKNEINSYKITINNNGNINIKNLEVIDNFDNHYRYIDNSLKLNNILINNSPNYIFIPNLNIGEKHIITFDVLAKKSGTYISNIAHINYDYNNLIREQITLEKSSNEVVSTIIETISQEIINLLDGISKEENIISVLINQERLKLQNILEKTTDKEMILLINKSIEDMLIKITETENISKEKLESLINRL